MIADVGGSKQLIAAQIGRATYRQAYLLHVLLMLKRIIDRRRANAWTSGSWRDACIRLEIYISVGRP